MTSMKVLADSLLNEENVPAEMYREFMEDIVAEIDRENHIISSLLTMVKYDKSKADMEVSTVNINELIELILKRLRPIAVTKNVELVLESYRPVVAEIDEVKLTLALTNLVENAIKYNIENGWVRVSINADHKYFYVKISDSGIGIPTDNVEQIFDRFYRVDKARARETGGTGLGLSITKSVIQLHKGVIKLYSKENEGTTFTVRIPLYYSQSGGEQ
jgi:signal transduction histidine kinase